jgi:hypothetical protein
MEGVSVGLLPPPDNHTLRAFGADKTEFRINDQAKLITAVGAYCRLWILALIS